jgi:hypothetical protein
MAALTLLEAAKLNPGEVLRNTVVELYAGSSGIIENLPFININGNTYKHNEVAALPGMGFRGVNEAYTANYGILNPIVDSLVIAGGDLDVDKFIVDTQGQQQRSIQEQMKIQALSLMFTKKFIKGDNQNDPREFDGLQARIGGNQKIAAGATANGTALSLAMLDQVIDKVLNPTHLIMNKAMKRRLTTAARNYQVSGFITYGVDAFGRRIEEYNGLPIITVDLDETQTAILGFNEAATSGTATGSSIYVVSFDESGVAGLQNGRMSVRDLGELQTQPAYRTRIEWYTGMGIFNPRAAARLWSIADAAVTA